MTKSQSSLHSNIVLREQDKNDVYEKYEVVKVLGQGSMGAVSKVRIRDDKVGGSAFEHKTKGLFGFLRKKKTTGSLEEEPSNDHFYALKSIILDRISDDFLDELRNELDILRNLDHPNIVKAHEVYHTRRQIYLVLELCDGGDLFARAPYSERESGRICEQLLSAVNYMHKHNVVHRDLKFENVMFENKSEGACIKVIDFGLSKKFLHQPEDMKERVGTIYTMAPQVLQGVYSSKADLWAVGVITYMLLSSSMPFYNKRQRKMIDLIMRADYNYNAAVWEHISSDAKDFVDKLLVVDPARRMDASQALQHQWIVNREQLVDEKPSPEVLAQIDDSLVKYRDTSKLKKLALTVIAHRSTTEEIVQLRKAFDQFDTQRNGIITYEEFHAALKKLNYDEKSLQEIFSSIDINGNGCINWTEFLAATIDVHGHIEEDRIAEAFDRLDSDDSGYISKKNLRELLGSGYSAEMVDQMIHEADADGDGQISYQEFLSIFRKNTKTLATEATQIKESAHPSDHTLVGLEAKIPGGKYDSNLDDNLKAQLKRQQRL